MLVLAVALGGPLKLVGLSNDELPVPAHAQARANADFAIDALFERDLTALGRELSANRADPVFAYYFTRRASPRDLGDTLATVADADRGGALRDDVGVTMYERTLTELAGTLALATRGVGALTLPPTWSVDFVKATTTPAALYDDPSASEARITQDLANKQNLLLLLARGQWSTNFLKEVTTAYWAADQESLDAVRAMPLELFVPTTPTWPGVNGPGTAPSPNGTLLTDGMVALSAALTANPEAAGWAFTEFKPGTDTVLFGEAQHPVGVFTRHLFFDREYADSDLEGDGASGATAALTALISAAQATGGSYTDGAAGPLADVHVLQQFQDDVAQARIEDSGHWYGKAVDKIGAWGHVVLDMAGTIPIAGEPADLINATWYAIEGDWVKAGLSAASAIPLLGHAALTAKVVKGAKARKAVDHTMKAVKVTTKGGKLLLKATDAGDGIYVFHDAEDFLDALGIPVSGVTYRYGATSYELAPDGKTLIHLSGPDRSVIEQQLQFHQGPDHSQAGQFVPSSEAGWQAAREAEEQALDSLEADTGNTVVRIQVRAHIDGLANSRFYDGLVRKSDGTYEAVEVQTGEWSRTTAQAAFDTAVSTDTPATAILVGATISITSVREVYVK